MFRHLYQSIVKRPTLPRMVIGRQHFFTSQVSSTQQQLLGHDNRNFIDYSSRETIDEHGNTPLMWYCFHGEKHHILDLLGCNTNLFNNKEYNTTERVLDFLRSIITTQKTYEIPAPHRVCIPDDPPESFPDANS